MIRRIAFRALPALASAAVLFVAGSSMAQASTVKAHAAGASVSVAASEYKFVLSTKSAAKPGAVTFKITNKGHVPHDFAIDKKKSAMVAPGKSTTLTVTFAKKGAYTYTCTVPGHAALGMKGTFTVK
jgi:uncharacterized cupredoxin-like copper-binding protein